MGRRGAVWASTWTLVCVTLWGGGAAAQSRLSVEASIGGDIPLSPMARTSLVLSEEIVGSGTAGIPSLVDRYGLAGLRATLRVVSESFEAGYTFTLNGWARSVRRCEGDRPAPVLADGTVDDAEVVYQCGLRERLELVERATPVQTHALTGGLRFWADPGASRRRRQLDQGLPVLDARRSGVFRLYGVIAGGPRVATFPIEAASRRLRPGFGLEGGGGLETRFSPSVLVGADVRYVFGAVWTARVPAESAIRAVAADRGVVSTVIDLSHSVVVAVTVRLELR